MMLFAAAALPSLSTAVTVWICGVAIISILAIIFAGIAVGQDEPYWRAAAVVAAAWVLIVVMISVAVILSHHAAWVDYRRDPTHQER
jgi:hypothetical protein